VQVEPGSIDPSQVRRGIIAALRRNPLPACVSTLQRLGRRAADNFLDDFRMANLPESRRYGSGSTSDRFVSSTLTAVAADDLARPRLVAGLRRMIEARLDVGDDATVIEALRAMPAAASYRLFHEATARCIDTPAVAASGVVARSFALPIVIVAAGTRPARIGGELADIGALQALFERSNALGPTRNFGMSNALCTLEDLERLSPLALYRSVRNVAAGEIGESLPPTGIDVAMGQEQTHLRFLVGAGVTPVAAPGFAETAANIGTWGRDCAKLLADQLTAPGVQVLALPRPPRDLLTAPHVGRCAQLETALNLFASNAVRKLRRAVGDPVVIVSAHENAEIRVTLSSPFAQDLVEGFPWPLHPLDDLAVIERTVSELFSDMRVNDVRIVERVLPAERVQGVPLYPRTDEWDMLCTSLHH